MECRAMALHGIVFLLGMMDTIETPRRFIYLNSYAFLLIFLGVCMAFVPCSDGHVGWVIAKWVAVAFSGAGAASILLKWKNKKRQYRFLIEKNRNGFQPDSFRYHMQAPCGRLLIHLVFRDLGFGKKEWKMLVHDYGTTLRIVFFYSDKRVFEIKL